MKINSIITSLRKNDVTFNILKQNPLSKTKGNKGGIGRIKNKNQNDRHKSNHINDNIKCERIKQHISNYMLSTRTTLQIQIKKGEK